MKRFSVLYQLNEQYVHIGASTQQEARTILHQLTADSRRTPVGIYDDKTELIDWAPADQLINEQASIGEQGSRGEAMILLVQALRRRDSSWHPLEGVHRPSFFA